WLLQLPWLCAPEGLEALRNACAGANPQRMLREMAELLHRYCERQALLLVLEDLHWSDSASIGLLEYLLRGRQPARLLLLCSLRPGELAGSGHPLEALRHDLNLRGLSEELALRPLGIEQLGEY